MPRCGDLAIFVMMTDKPMALSLVHARGVIIEKSKYS